MATLNARPARRLPLRTLAVGSIIVALAAALWFTRMQWLPRVAGALKNADAQPAKEDAAPEGEHQHAHGEAQTNSITLSERGLKNIGFEPVTVSLQGFERTVTMPGIVAEQPGRTQVHLTAPLSGVLTNVYVTQGEALEAGSKMFDVRLTHEELVTAQQEYLKTAESLEVVEREIARLQSLGEGVIAGKRILEQQYEKQKLEAALETARQALKLHGLDDEQAAEILKSRQLLQSLTVRAPEHFHTGDSCKGDHLFHVQRLPVSPGQQVDTSQELAVLADHCELYVEGRAFENDAVRLRTAAREGRPISASLPTDEGIGEIKGLKLLYVADQIDAESRAFHFYLLLPNEVVLDQKSAEGKRFIEWRFKPGQRMELKVPVERWEDRIVVPVEAIVDEGAEWYVYRQNGKRFDRVAVHVEYRNGTSAVIANDGALFPGDVIAGRGAYQMHLALKNQAGGGVDPHAGHNH